MSTRWGIAGAGRISHDFVNALATYRENSEHKVVAVGARNINDAKAFAEKHGIPKFHEGYENLANDPEVDAVYVGTITPAHLNVCKILLNGGKHVLCEKTLTMNVNETKELIEFARSKNLFLMEGIWSRFVPAYVELRQELEKKSIGEIYSVNVQFGTELAFDHIFDKNIGGGSMLVIGVYCIQFASLVFRGEKPQKVLAGGKLSSFGTDESTSITLVYKDGKTATLTTNLRVKYNNTAVVYGSKGSITVQSPFWCSQQITTPEGVFNFPFGEAGQTFIFENSTGLKYQAQHLRECLQKGLTESPVMPLDETLLMAEIMEEVRRQVGVEFPQSE